MTLSPGCDAYRELIESLLGDDISDEPAAELMSHSSDCPQCRHLLLLHLQLSSPGIAPPQPPPELLRRVRDRVWSELKRRRKHELEPARPFGDVRKLSSLLAWRPMAFAYGLLMLLIGFAVAWGVGSALEPSGEGLLVSQLSRQAQHNQAFADSKDSPYLFSNVTLRNTEDGRVALGFDMTTHMEMVRRREDPLVHEVLVQSLMEPASIGERLKAVSFTEGLLEGKVKEGLLFAARFDPSQAVRLKALSILMDQPEDLQIQSACLAILREDDSIQMRLLAIDYLGRGDGGTELLENLMQSEEWQDSPPLRVRAARYIR